MLFSILNPDNPEWDILFESLPLDQQDIFYSPSFARLCKNTLNRDDEVLCAAMTSKVGVLLYPFVKRSLARLTGFPSTAGLYDLISLYGRGGIVGSLAALMGVAPFHTAMAAYFRENAIVCGFDRFHPVIANDARAAPDARIMDVGGFVVVDMRREMDAIENTFKQSVRKDLRKAERNGITCFAESNCDHLKEFLDIYYHTMGRNSAAEFYYFNEEYFLALAKEIPGQFHFFYAVAGNDIVSCELVLHHGKYCHSFLGGTKREALPLCANPILKREIIRFLKGRGCEYFLLGGGSKPDDGIFNFKKAYAPEGVLPSRIGGMIWNHHAYEQLREDMSSAGVAISANRFQFYDMS
jgi:hypothetical protein